MLRLIDEVSIVDHINDAVIATDLKFHIVRWNNGAAALYGWARADALGRSMPTIVPTLRYLDGGTSQQALVELRERGAWRGIVVQAHRDGHELSIEASLRMLYDDEHTPVGIIAINRDIGERLALIERERTARIAAEAAQRHLEVVAQVARALVAAEMDLPVVLETIVQHISAEIGDACSLRLLSADGRHLLPSSIAHWDANVRAMLQTHFGDQAVPVGDNILGQVAQTGRPVFLPHIPDGHVDRTLIAAEKLPSVMRSGAHARIVVPLRAHERILGILALARDITPTPYTADDLKLVQELADCAALGIENARLFQATQEAVRTREVFLSVAAHELRTPLTSLMGHVFRLTRRAAQDAASEHEQRSLRAITAQGDRLNALIEQLLDVSRLQLGTFTIQRRPLDLAALIGRVVDDLLPTLEQHQLVLHPSPEPLHIQGDAARLEQVLYNVLHNAIKYSPHGGAIDVRLSRTAEHALIAITDHGIGIPANDLPQLFQQFYRASNVDARRISGLGIGLYLVKGIIVQHGGTVDVESHEGAGSTFTVRLPLLKEPPNAAALLSAPSVPLQAISP